MVSSPTRHDLVTVVALAALAYSLTVFLHESTHALSCIALGAKVTEYGALYIDCPSVPVGTDKLVAASAAIVNVLLGFAALWLLRARNLASTSRWFIWLFMLMNFLTGAGYWMFSGIGNIGDWAVVIAGWQPAWAWRVGMALVGSAAFMGFVFLALKELGRIIGGQEPELYKRALTLGVVSYGTAPVVIVLAGLMNPYGFASLPVTAGLAAAFGAMSPLIWMMFWFRAPNFAKLPGEPLVITRSWPLIAGAVIWLVIYAVIFGRTLYF